MTTLSITAAIEANESELALRLIENLPSVDSLEFGLSPLMIASLKQRPELVSALLDMGADANLQCSNRRTPLHYAMIRPSLAVTEALLRAGADANIPDINGNTPLMEAVGRAHAFPDIIAAVMRHGGNPRIVNHAGVSPLSLAQQSSPSLVKYLAE